MLWLTDSRTHLRRFGTNELISKELGSWMSVATHRIRNFTLPRVSSWIWLGFKVKLAAAVFFKTEINCEMAKCHLFFWVTKTITVEFDGELKRRGCLLVATVKLGWKHWCFSDWMQNKRRSGEGLGLGGSSSLLTSSSLSSWLWWSLGWSWWMELMPIEVLLLEGLFCSWSGFWSWSWLWLFWSVLRLLRGWWCLSASSWWSAWRSAWCLSAWAWWLSSLSLSLPWSLPWWSTVSSRLIWLKSCETESWASFSCWRLMEDWSIIVLNSKSIALSWDSSCSERFCRKGL